MVIQNETKTQTGPWTFLLTWGSTLSTPTYYIWINGVLSQTTVEEELQIDLQTGENVIVDIFDSVSDTPGDAFPNFATLQWNPSGDGESFKYKIQQFVDAAWATLAVIPDTGLSVYRYETQVLADDTVHQFRIIPIDFNDANEGAIRSISFRMRRYPPAPDVTYSYDSGTGKTTVAAA